LWAKRLHEIGYAIEWINAEMERDMFDGMQITEVRIRPAQTPGEVLIVVKAITEGRKLVGFHSGASVAEALIGCRNRLESNLMKWKDDEWTGPALGGVKGGD